MGSVRAATSGSYRFETMVSAGYLSYVKRWRGCKVSGGEGRLVQALNDAGHSGRGGRAFSWENEIELPVLARHIGGELRTQYILGYCPHQMPRDGKWHKIQVK